MASLVAEINIKSCKRCHRCADSCENKTIMRSGAHLKVVHELCHGCGACVDNCPFNSVKLVSRNN